MYLPPHFSVDDPAAIRRLLSELATANLVTVLGGVPTASLLPVLFDPDGGTQGSLVGHLAAANPQARSVGDTEQALMILDGPAAFVSPSNYAEKQRSGKVVPTWNYQSVHVTGALRLHTDPAWKHRLVTRLTDHHEADRDQPWAVTDAPTDYIEAHLKGIVGIELVIERIEAKAKLSQNQTAADQTRVADDLRSGSEQERRVAEAMDATATS